jgi:hypothetical protein
MLLFRLNAVQGFALQYLTRVPFKEGQEAIKDYYKAITCIEKPIKESPPPEYEVHPPLRLEHQLGDNILALPKQLTGWLLPMPILLILRWLFDAWIKKSTCNHRAAIGEIEKLIELEE